ncbi:MAG: helix-hairpin-helix domain-containing protein [Sphingobacteriales bacterium]|nr:helix-hairpin-helix domain-containing protein [Sphingobacteriales bacterium]
MKKEWVKDYFTFTKKERTGIIVLVILVLILLFIPYLFPYLKKRPKHNNAEFENEIAKLKQLKIDSSQAHNLVRRTNNDDNDNDGQVDYYQPKKRNDEENRRGELFAFDPNTATGAEWKRLGIKDKTIQTIQNYLSKGGRFRKPGDLYKVYGLKEEDVTRMIPYVAIKSETVSETFKETPSIVYENKKAKSFSVQIEINTADTNTLIVLPGIGSKLSQRIINFRDKLGGFYSVEQVGETFALPDSTFQKIKPNLICNTSLLKKININTADLNILKAHPYIRYALANVIIQYRNEHGNYNSVDDLRKISMMTDELFRKISPYLTIENE